MKKITRRQFLQTASIACGTATLAACGADSSTAASSDAATNGDSVSSDIVTPAGEYPIVTEPVTLTIMAAQHALVEDMETNAFTKFLEEKTGVHIDWQTVAESNATEKLNVMLSTGSNLPDIFLGFKIEMTQQIVMGEEQGLFVNLEPYFEEYAPNLIEMYATVENLQNMCTTPSGGIYGVAGLEEAFHVKYPAKAWIQQSPLDAMGAELPTTIDEFTDLLREIKATDPDSIPFTAATTGYGTNLVPFIMSAFLEYYEVTGVSTDIPFTVIDGKIAAAFTQDQFKDGLMYLNSLMKDGLLDTGALTQDQKQLKTLTGNTDNIVGVVCAGAPLAAVSGVATAMDWTALNPLVGPSGNSYTRFIPIAPISGRFVVTKECKNVEAAVRWMDYFLSTEGTLNSMIGAEGVNWAFNTDDSRLGINGLPATYERLTPYGEMQNVNWEKMAPVNLHDSLRNGMLAVGGSEDMESKLYQETQERYEPMNDDRFILPVTIGEDVMAEFVDITTALDTYLAQTTAEFIVGSRSFDDWDKHISTLDKMGVPRLVEIMNETYSAQYGTLGLV